MGRRRKKYKRVIRKVRRIPSVFHCPHCGARSMTIEFVKKNLDIPGSKKAIIRCGSCGLEYGMIVPEIYESVDVYNKFVDMYNEGSIEVRFVKKSEEVTEEEEVE